GLESSGPHTNGFSLIRRVFANVPLDTTFDEFGLLSDALLAPHTSYLNTVNALRIAAPVKGLAHITGGGFFENIPRILPDGCGAELDRASWAVPPIFTMIRDRGQVKDEEMYRVFNMGIGMVAILDSSAAESLTSETVGVVGPIGRVVEG